MSFLNPILLFGTLAVSVPIIIHLLNRRQVQRMPWAAMRFLQQAVETNERRLQVEDLLLLLLRCLLIALLAFALARPTLNAAGNLFGNPASATLLIVDHSYSMTQTSGVSSRFDIAKKAANQIIDAQSSGSSVALWLAGDGVSPIIAEPTRDLALARKTIADAKPSDRATDLLPAIRAGIDMLKRTQSTAKEMYVITDGQAGGFRQLGAIKQLLDSAKDQVKATIVLVEQPETANLAVSSLVQSSGVAAIDRPLRFSAVVTNYGTDPARDVRVSLKVASSDATDRATAAAGAPVDDATIDLIEPGQSKAVSLFGRLKTDGYYAVTASISTDRVPADDHRTIVVRGTKRVKALLVDGDVGREPREAETFFLKAVFGASGNPPLIAPTSSDPGSMSSENLDDYDVIVLANVADLSPNTTESLVSYVKKGGGLVIFTGDRIRRSFYNDELSGKHNLLPATIGEPKGDEKAQERMAAISDAALDHPIATLWKDPASGRLSTVSIYKYSPLTIVPPKDAKSPAAKPVLKLGDGSPVAAEWTFGDGRVIVFGVTADAAWSDLPAKPGIYLPLLFRSVGSIVEKRDESLNITVGQRIISRTPMELLGNEANIKYLEVADALPDSRRVELSGDVAQVTGDPTEYAGTYELKVEGQPALLYAAQTDPAESNLEMLSANQADDLGKSARILPARIDTDLAAGMKQERTGTELIFPLAVLLLIIGVSESVLAMWFSRSR